MPKSKTSKQFTKCNLKQIDIFSAIQNWKSIKIERDMKKLILTTEIIEIADSDSESVSATTQDNNLPKRKRPLVKSFSDTEDEQVTPVIKEEMTSAMPKIKRPLNYSFSDEDDFEGNKSSCTGSQYSQMLPVACSTPVSLSDKAESEDGNLTTYVGREILDGSQVNSDCSVTLTADETTILVERNSLEPRIRILDNTVLSPAKNDACTLQNTTNAENVESSSKNGCSEQETPIKKQKTIDTNERSASQEPSTSAYSPKGKNGSKWLCKRKLDQTKTSSEQRVNTMGDNNQNTGDKGKNQGKKHTQSDNTLKISSKENLPHCSKDKNDTSPGSGDENSPNDKTTATKEMANKDQFQTQKTVDKESGNASKRDKTRNGSPKKTLNTSDSPSKPVPPKKEERKMNKEPLKLIIDLFNVVLSCTHINTLLESERDVIRTFLSMKDDRYQYACLKLFTRQKKWYNAFKFNKLVYLEMEETEVCEMVNEFSRNGIVDTEYMGEDIFHLLQRLDCTELRSICDKFRMKKTLKAKQDMIDGLLKYSYTQPTLSKKTTKDLLKEEIQKRMGRCMKASDVFHNAFHSTYLLGTFTNYRFVDIKEYFDTKRLNVMFPTFPVDEYAVFRSRADFVSFTQAIKYRKELETCADPLQCLQICKTIFSELKRTEIDRGDEGRFQDAPHLVKFTARAVYAGALTFVVEKLFAKFPDDVKEWLEYLIRKVGYPHRIGYWYHYLIWLYMRHLRPLNYDRAARLLIKALDKERDHLSEVQLYTLRKRGEQLICTVKYKLEQMNHDLIAHLLPKPIRVKDFPETTVDAKTIRGNEQGRKRNYETRDAEGNRTIYKVEDFALTHYMETLLYTGGAHCEGAYVKATFTLFFFDIIYSENAVVPGTFLSKLQCEPLDMNSRLFYPNRKDQIDRRLREIENEWSDGKVLEFVVEQYERHSHQFSLCEVGTIVKDADFLRVLVECIGRRVLAKIFERLVKNFREYRSGLPDLLLWNADKKECKFVEVKGENDKLSVGQTLWLNYLHTIGAKIEVCHVHSIGSKRKLKKVDKKLLEPSTSTSSL